MANINGGASRPNSVSERLETLEKMIAKGLRAEAQTLLIKGSEKINGGAICVLLAEAAALRAGHDQLREGQDLLLETLQALLDEIQKLA